ncbi:MAG: pyridoxamine 5'-phosphate oxidase [Verrucomicrobia bacterium]|nr:MAG: pyridoxamine 5'-phosphate oxidase [Verrucomicrobiota bacterium]
MALTSQTLADLRQDYSLRGLDLAELDKDPMVQFQHWLGEAHSHDLIEPNAMTLATVDAMGQPWTRTVLLKVCDARGFTFFTNYKGTKAAHIAAEPRAALTFWWSALERQVNITGRIVQTSREESEAYFASRPLPSQLGAWASPQSSTLETREALEHSFAEQKARFEGHQIPCPEHWGGFCLKPDSIEFWQGRRSRLHDRFRYDRSPGGWGITRLAP